jgi:large subunit ribosomal protein L21
VALDEVLFVSGEGDPRVGAPRVEGVSVLGTVVGQDRDAKIRVFKYKKRKHHRRTRGHRQSYTAVRIDAVQG